MHCPDVWQHSSNANIKIVHNSIEHILWNPSDFFSDNVLFCLWIVFTNSIFKVGWDGGNRMARGYWFGTKWVCPMGRYAWGIQVFCSRSEGPPNFSNRTLEYSRHNFQWDRFISHQIDNPCQSYFQDLNLPDYFLRGFLKDRVCENNQHTRENIRK